MQNAAMKTLKSLQELLFPVRCIGCSQLGIEICSFCRRYWHPHIFRTSTHSDPSIPIYSAISYSPLASKVILAAKEDGILQAELLITDAIRHALEFCIRENNYGFLVPIPSRKSAARLRGRQFIYDIAKRISTETTIPTCEILSHSRVIKDQSGLDASNRVINMSGALTASRFIGGRAILIDDLVTTGATLSEAARALRAQGITVSAAVTACVAEPLR